MSTTAPDINDLSLLNEPCEGIDPNANAEEFFKVPLVPDGDHIVVLAAGQDGVGHDRQKSGDKAGQLYVKAHLMMKIIDPGDPSNGLVLFDRVNSIVFESRGTSRLHGVMALAGSPIPAQMSKGEIIEFVKVALAQSPRVKVSTQWQASSKCQSEEEASRVVASGYRKSCRVGDYYTFLKGMKSFPASGGDDGSPVHYSSEVENPLTGEKVTAQAQVVRYDRAG